MEQEEEYLGTNNRTVNGKSVLYMKEHAGGGRGLRDLQQDHEW